MAKCTAKTLKGIQCKNKGWISGLCGIHGRTGKEPQITKTIKDVKSSLKKTEEINVSKIVERMRRPDDVIREEFFNTFGEKINGVRKSGGSRNDHYDFEIYIRGKGWKKVEHKGSDVLKNFGEKPWSSGVQFYNGTGNIFTIGRKYARGFYDKYIVTRIVSEKYKIDTPIPEYEVWEKAIFSQGNGCKTPFISELRKKTVYHRTSHKGLYNERDEFTDFFNSTLEEADFESLKNEANDMITKVMGHKDYWLQIHGNLDGDFKVKWTKNENNHPITKVNVLKSKDCTYELVTDGGTTLQAKLRWGYNQGVSNLRVDLK